MSMASARFLARLLSGVRERALLGVGLFVIALFYGGPLLMLCGGAFRSAPPGLDGTWTLLAWTTVFDDPRVLEAIRNSALIAALNLLVAVPFAAILVFLSQRTDCHGRGLITPAMLAMFAMPSLFYALGY
jgi:iron(III) transport system permease protein